MTHSAEFLLRESNKHLDVLARISQELILDSVPNETSLQSIIDKVCRSLEVEMGFSYAVIDQRLKLVAQHGLSPVAIRLYDDMRMGQNLCGKVAESRTKVILDRTSIGSLPEASAAIAMGATAYAGFPLLAHGRVLGTISFASSRRDEFRPDEIQLVQAVADQVAITLERQSLFRQLKESEEMFRTLADNMSQFAWMTDATGWIFWYNQRWFEYTGRTMQEMEGWGWEAVHHPQHLARVKEKFQRHLADGQPWEDTFPLRSKDGEYRWFLSRALPIRSPDGRIARWFGTNTDITERIKAGEALAISEARFRLASDAVPGLVFDWDLASNRIWRSDGVQGLLGYAPGECDPTFEWWTGHVHPEDRKQVTPVDAILLDAGGQDRYECEYRVRHRDGRWLAVWERGAVLRDPDGQAVRVIGSITDISARREAEQASREKTTLLETLLAVIPVGIGVALDPECRTIRVNPAFAVRLGVSPEDNASKTAPAGERPSHFRVLDRHGRPVADEQLPMQVAAREGKVVDGEELEVVHEDGRVVRLLEYAAPLLDEHGRPRGSVGAFVDVSERWRSERALEEAAQRLQLALRIGRTGVWDWDFRSGRMAWSEESYAIFGRSPETFPGTEGGFAEVVHPDDLASVRRRMDESIRQRKEYEQEFRIVSPGGDVRWVASLGSLRFGPSGEPEAMLGTVRDITTSKRAEQNLRESEARFRLLADSAPVLIWLSDAGRNCTWLNRTWLDFVGGTLENQIGRGRLRHVHPEDLERFLRTYEERFDRRREFEVEYRLRRHDGEYRWILDRGMPRYEEDGGFVGYVGSCIDITEIVLAREAMTRHGEELERLVRERTSELELSHQRLRVSERLASLGTLSAGLGHDMGNLLVPLRIRLESLSLMSLPDQAREDVQSIKTSAEYLQKLADGLRLLALDPKRAQTSQVPDLRQWWNEAESVMRSVIPRSVRLEFESEGEQAAVAISKAALTQVIFNLVQNAGDAMRERHAGVIRIQVRSAAESVCIMVRDDGPGMSPEVLSRCMEPFFTTKTRGISTGLGLALVYGLIRDAGGSVHVESQPGEGTTFTIHLPRSRSRVETLRHSELRTAFVRVKDARLRSFAVGELRAQGFALVPDVQIGDAMLVVSDDIGLLDRVSKQASVVLLGDASGETVINPERVTLVGQMPRVLELGRVIREVSGKPGASFSHSTGVLQKSESPASPGADLPNAI